MRAVVYRGVNDLRLETVPVPRIGPRELLVRVAACGVCPTDIKKIQYGTVPPPRIFGHETAGVIARLGSGVSELGWKIGDRVALHHHVPCLDCHYCRHHAFAQCTTYKRTGITAGFEPAGGGYAEYVRVMPFVLPGVVKIPAKNSFAEGALLEPVNTVLKAVRRLNLLPGDNVLVAGQGPVGLMFTRLLQLVGVRVIATDLMASRLKLARKFGARWTCPPSRLLSQVTRHSSPLDAAVIAVPSDAAVQQALRLLRGGGRLMLFAHTRRSAGDQPRRSETKADKHIAQSAIQNHSRCHFNLQPSAFSLDLASVCVDEKDLLGSYSSDFTLQSEVARLVFSRQLDVRGLISHCLPLDQTAAAVQLASRPTEDSLKIIVGTALSSEAVLKSVGTKNR